ncbi:PREDICTED: DNA replication inhibitor plutonium [Rhagoletis zephyria]|uniref:DNA replication inhibitor plutonium n=1 Tax=Rhagoletis zephyria TaxID=28612 RepID=UPI0008119CB9|nr:PREDICTED: DNA replication inhibitor plutonium [Rhagoletis zephyria]
MSVSQCIRESNANSLYALLAQRKSNREELELEETDDYGNTPLLKACFMGKPEHAEVLIRYGANLKAINYLGQNALTMATYAGSLEVVRLLLRFRSYSDFNKSSILPALCVACLRQNKTLIDFYKRFTTTEEEVKTAHGLSPAQISEWVEIYNKSGTETRRPTPANGAAYRMR